MSTRATPDERALDHEQDRGAIADAAFFQSPSEIVLVATPAGRILSANDARARDERATCHAPVVAEGGAVLRTGEAPRYGGAPIDGGRG